MKIIAVIALLLLGGADTAMARSQGFTWTPNTDLTMGYNLYYRADGASEWSSEVVNGRETNIWYLTLPAGIRFEVAITAWSTEYQGESIPYVESAKSPSVFVSELDGIPVPLVPAGLQKIEEEGQ